MERLRIQVILDILFRLKSRHSERAVAKDLRLSRITIRRYREMAAKKGYRDKDVPLPEAQQLAEELGQHLRPAPNNISSVEPYRTVVESLLNQDVEMAAIHGKLIRDHGYTGSYSSVRRFVCDIRPKEVVVRVENPPGKQAHVDFGGAGMMRDPETGRQRRTYCFVMTLSQSRHQYVEFVFDQSIPTWISCHRRAFESFRGVPE